MKRSALAVALVAIASLAIPAAAGAAKGDKVEVMLRNLYLGAPIDKTFPAATSFADFTSIAADTVAEVDRNNFPARAQLIAAEIDREDPDIIGLNEVALWRYDIENPDGDLGPQFGFNGTPAEPIRYDFRQILLDALAARGLDYEVASVQQQFDGEFPVQDRPGDIHEDPEDADGMWDARLTMHDMILVRDGVEYSNPRGANYEAAFTPVIANVTEVPFLRGWASIEANVRGQKFRFVVTHLESAADPSNSRQAKELVTGPADARKDVVLVGDFNSDPEGNKEDRKAYNIARKAGFVERQIQGPTYGHKMTLDDPNDQKRFRRKIDYIMVNDADVELDEKRSSKFGIQGRRTPDGFWPSDHAGLFSTLRFP